MATKDFSFSKKDDNIKNRQAILAMENDADIDCLSNSLRKRRCRVLGKSQDVNEIRELLRKHKSGIFFLDFDIPAMITPDFMLSVRINHPEIKVVVLAKTMDKEQLGFVKGHGVKRFLAKPLTSDAVNKLLSGTSF